MATVERLRRNQTAFDYVVVGGGTAGCVIASRLAAELPSASILLIEGGESDVGKDDLHNLKLQVNAWGGEHDYRWSSVPQPKGKMIMHAKRLSSWLTHCRREQLHPALAWQGPRGLLQHQRLHLVPASRV
ncbi:hypothetical protein AUP68_02218 [Ilyonectria robusta]